MPNGSLTLKSVTLLVNTNVGNFVCKSQKVSWSIIRFSGSK